MARVAARIYVPLDVGFFDDDKVIEAGEKAAYLYLAILCKAKGLDSNGILSGPQIGRLGVVGWKARLADLVACDLVVELPQQPGYYAVVGWLKWNESAEDRASRLADDRRRKAEKKAAEGGSR